MKVLKDMVEGGNSFWDAVWKRYLKHELNIFQLEEIIEGRLKFSGGTLKGLLPLFHIEERDYKRFKDFLRNQGITKKRLVEKINKKASHSSLKARYSSPDK